MRFFAAILLCAVATSPSFGEAADPYDMVQRYEDGVVPNLRSTAFSLDMMVREAPADMFFDVVMQVRGGEDRTVGLVLTCAFGDACEPFQTFFEAIGGNCDVVGRDTTCTPPDPGPRPLPSLP